MRVLTKRYNNVQLFAQQKTCLPYKSTRARKTVTQLPLFIDKFIDHSSWIINLLLDVLLCGIGLYFYSLFFFLTRLTGSSKYGTTRKNPFTLLDVLLCSIANYFYELCGILKSP